MSGGKGSNIPEFFITINRRKMPAISDYFKNLIYINVLRYALRLLLLLLLLLLFALWF